MALATVAEALRLHIPRPFAPDISTEVIDLAGVKGRIYRPRGGGRGLLVVPGAAPGGVDDPRVVALARAFAHSRRTIFVPELDLYQQRLSEDDLDRIVNAAIGLSEETGAPVAMFGFSFGGSYGLVAAADPRLDRRLRLVAVFGAYFDLIGLVQAATTGTSLVGSQAIPWDGHPAASQALQTALEALTSQQGPLKGAWAGGPGPLPTDSQSVQDLLSNQDPELTYGLAARLPPNYRRLIDRFSPAAVASQIGVPVMAIHSTDDPTIPYGELLRLGEGIPTADLTTVSLFRHVNLVSGAWIRKLPDLWRLVRFTGRLLES
jgi:pimeloyl-ACP methyl ester carboxylesterase